MKNYFILSILLLVVTKQVYPQQNDTQAVFYNIGFGVIFGGIGALINKKPEQKWHKVLIKGVGQGSLGGLVIFGSKKLLSKVPQRNSLVYVWPSKLIYSVGNSIIENAASNRNFWERWHITIGFSRIVFNTSSKFTVQYKVLPVALYGTILTISKSSRFDFDTSIKTGTLVFRSDKSNMNNSTTFVNTILMPEEINENYFYHVLPHEIIHTYQYEDFSAINSFFNPIKYNFRKKSKAFSEINNWVYFDFQSFILYGLYNIESINTNCYYDNFFEHEAGYYSNTINCN